jgi:hypothetical protein
MGGRGRGFQGCLWEAEGVGKFGVIRRQVKALRCAFLVHICSRWHSLVPLLLTLLSRVLLYC